MTAGQINPDAPDLADLLRKVAARDRVAFAALYRQTSAKLHGVVARILTRGDQSGEVLQEVFVRIRALKRSAKRDV